MALGELIDRNDQALDNPNWMGHWIKFYRFRNVLEGSGFIKLAEKIETGEIALDDAHAACMLGVYDLLARNILMSHPRRLSASVTMLHEHAAAVSPTCPSTVMLAAAPDAGRCSRSLRVVPCQRRHEMRA